MFTATCTVCQSPYETHYPTKKTTCSTSCRQYARKHPGFIDGPARRCEMCGVAIEGKRRATRFCSSPCRSAAGKRRLGTVTRARYGRPDKCQYCHGEMPTTRTNAAMYCSDRCSDWASLNNPVPYEDRHKEKECPRCGSRFTGGRVDRQFCSRQCQMLFNAQVRRSREAALPREDFDDAEIYARDNWTCHVCGGAMDASITERSPGMPTLDHLISYAHPDCPGHVRYNVAGAHLSCNQSRQGRVRQSDLDLVALLRATYERG